MESLWKKAFRTPSSCLWLTTAALEGLNQRSTSTMCLAMIDECLYCGVWCTLAQTPAGVVMHCRPACQLIDLTALFLLCLLADYSANNSSLNTT